MILLKFSLVVVMLLMLSQSVLALSVEECDELIRREKNDLVLLLTENKEDKISLYCRLSTIVLSSRDEFLKRKDEFYQILEKLEKLCNYKLTTNCIMEANK